MIPCRPHFFRCLLLASVLAVVPPFKALAGAPAIPAGRAVEIAQQQLDMRGIQSSVFIESLALRSATMLGGEKTWTVLWSESIPAGAGLFEVGASVDMKGSIVRLLKKTASKARTSP